jgi:hypothetical protein
MMTSTRSLPLLVLIVAAAACGGDATGLTPGNDAGATEDGGVGDDDAPTRDDVTSADGSDGGRGLDGTSRGDGATSDDAPGVPDAASEGGPPSCAGAIDLEFLREKLSKLSGDLPVNLGGADVNITERHSAAYKAYARQFLTAEYQALGFTVSEHTYATGVNLLASRAGADSKFLVLSAHYDTIRETVPGADDDGSGVIGALATAKALQGCRFDHSLRIIAFDEEENGTVGSRAYVSQLQSSGESADLIGDVQLEMFGYHTKEDGGFLLVDCKSSEGDRPESKFLNDAVLAAVARGALPLEPHAACVSSSDHGAFWSASKPAVVFSEEFSFSGANSNPCYHKECDTVSFINFDYFAKMATLSVLVTADLVGAR